LFSKGGKRQYRKRSRSLALLVILSSILTAWLRGLNLVQAQTPGPSHIHLAAQGCDGEHDRLISPNGNILDFYPFAPPYPFSHLVIHYADNETVWGKPSYGSADCPDSSRCRRATFQLNPIWHSCVPNGHVYEVLTLDGQPILKSTLLQVLDPTTKAIVKLNLALVQAGKLPVTFYLELALATLAGASGDFDAAIQHLERAVQLEPDVSAVHVALGTAYTQKGKLDKAIEELTKAISLQPNNFLAHVNLGDAFARSGRREEQIEAEQRAIRLNPNRPDAYYLLGLGYGATKRPKEAAVAL
jgi:tetratricopeptide (TPR) repeat protein